MLEVGRVCLKTAGRDAGKFAVVVEVLDDTYVMIDGNVRRKKCNINHLEPTAQKLELKKKASTEDVREAMKKAELKVVEKKKGTKERKKTEKQKRKRKAKAPVKEEKPKKTAEKKPAKKEQTTK